MTTTRSTNRALQIQPTGLLLEQDIPADSGESIRELIGCRTFDVISLQDRIDLWVDDEGLLQAEPVLNLPATILAHALRVQTAIFGTAVALSVDGTTGETLGLTDRQVTRIRGALSDQGARSIGAVQRTLALLLGQG